MYRVILVEVGLRPNKQVPHSRSWFLSPTLPRRVSSYALYILLRKRNLVHILLYSIVKILNSSSGCESMLLVLLLTTQPLPT